MNNNERIEKWSHFFDGMNLDELYKYYDRHFDGKDEIDDIEFMYWQFAEIPLIRERNKQKLWEKPLSKSLENKIKILAKALMKEYDIQNQYGLDFEDEVTHAIKKTAIEHFLYECDQEW